MIEHLEVLVGWTASLRKTSAASHGLPFAQATKRMFSYRPQHGVLGFELAVNLLG